MTTPINRQEKIVQVQGSYPRKANPVKAWAAKLVRIDNDGKSVRQAENKLIQAICEDSLEVDQLDLKFSSAAMLRGMQESRGRPELLAVKQNNAGVLLLARIVGEMAGRMQLLSTPEPIPGDSLERPHREPSEHVDGPYGRIFAWRAELMSQRLQLEQGLEMQQRELRALMKTSGLKTPQTPDGLADGRGSTGGRGISLARARAWWQLHKDKPGGSFTVEAIVRKTCRQWREGRATGGDVRYILTACAKHEAKRVGAEDQWRVHRFKLFARMESLLQETWKAKRPSADEVRLDADLKALKSSYFNDLTDQLQLVKNQFDCLRNFNDMARRQHVTPNSRQAETGGIGGVVRDSSDA